MRVALKASAAQALALALTIGAAWLWPAPWTPPPAFWLALHSLCAVVIGMALRLPPWWAPIQALFAPALVFTLSLHPSPSLFLVLFVLFWLIFRGNTRERVPLYLSNRVVWRAVMRLLPRRSGVRFLDLGGGLGGMLAWLAKARPDGEFHGVETAPLIWLLGALRLWRAPNARMRLGDLWREDLSRYDVVYAFLSPQPMPRLLAKAKAEMRPGSLLISNSFEAPRHPPDRIFQLRDRRRSRLLIWRM